MRTLYECAICRASSDSLGTIKECEARGLAPPEARPPRGLIVSCPWDDVEGFYAASRTRDKMYAAAVIASENDKHGVAVYVALFRNNGHDDYADFFGGRRDILYCGPRLGDWRKWPEAVPCRAFWRCVEAAKRADVTPLVLRDMEPVTLKEAGIIEAERSR